MTLRFILLNCDRYINWMLAKVDEWEKEEISVSQSEVQNLSDKIKADEVRMGKFVSTYLDGDIPKENYLKRKDEIMHFLKLWTFDRSS